MRTAMISLLTLAQIGWGVCASGQTLPAPVVSPLILMPTALVELNELRINTGTKAVLKDGTMNAVYVKKTPSRGNTYLNFHVDVASESGPVVLHVKGICLNGDGVMAAARRGGVAPKGKTISGTPVPVSYTPFDWFIDTGSAEVRGDSLTVSDKAIVQFTIEVPRAGSDALTLFVGSQRIGTVKEVRERIALDKRSE